MTKLRVWVTVLAAIAPLVAQGFSPAFAQSSAKPSFDVASVKPNNGESRGSSWAMQPGGRFTATNMPLALIIRNAFDVQPSQLVGLPEWASSERFDIAAKAEQEFPRTSEKPSLSQLMVQSLLEERFKLVAHRETRELPAYALVLARTDRRLGPQLKQSDVDCAAFAASRKPGGAASGAGAAATASPSPPTAGQRRPCTMMMAGGMLRAGSIPMSSLAATLSSPTQRMVVDRTGLTGNFDFDLTYSAEQSADTSRPSLFTALQEQLGLKLDAVRIPIEVLVLDRVERPTPD